MIVVHVTFRVEDMRQPNKDIKPASGENLKKISFVSLEPQGGGALSTYAYGSQSKKFLGNRKISPQLHCNPRISAHFVFRSLCMKMIDYETLQVKVRTASKEPKKYQLNNI